MFGCLMVLGECVIVIYGYEEEAAWAFYRLPVVRGREWYILE